MASALTTVTSAILQRYEYSVLRKLIYDGMKNGTPDSCKEDSMANTASPISSHAALKNNIISVEGVGIVMKADTLTPDFVKSCPITQDTKQNSRRGGVSERNQLDRYVFKVALEQHLRDATVSLITE